MEKLYFVHRMAGRAMFFARYIHGSLWICDHLPYGPSILGLQKETLGVSSLVLLCIINNLFVMKFSVVLFNCLTPLHCRVPLVLLRTMNMDLWMLMKLRVNNWFILSFFVLFNHSTFPFRKIWIS
jgi:hypothetical protein